MTPIVFHQTVSAKLKATSDYCLGPLSDRLREQCRKRLFLLGAYYRSGIRCNAFSDQLLQPHKCVGIEFESCIDIGKLIFYINTV
ncbi:hypothetical protein GF380_00135 [Candidatus Uhrbacteria bacterium]|nr:hypothetical protein [Candidatus Uhrbacteria bacterium]